MPRNIPTARQEFKLLYECMLIAALSTIVRRKPPRLVSVDGWIHRMWHIHTVEKY